MKPIRDDIAGIMAMRPSESQKLWDETRAAVQEVVSGADDRWVDALPLRDRGLVVQKRSPVESDGIHLVRVFRRNGRIVFEFDPKYMPDTTASAMTRFAQSFPKTYAPTAPEGEER